jgi:RNA polymerase sigma-70 factor (ECF subfamily)
MSLIPELIVRARVGDEQAMEQLICSYQGPVGAMVISIIGSDDDWEDVCQQIFLKMILGLARLKKAEFFEPWLFRITRNAAFDHLRRRHTRRFLVPWQESYDSIAGGTPETEPKVRSAALAAAISQLAPHDRELMALRRP